MLQSQSHHMQTWQHSVGRATNSAQSCDDGNHRHLNTRSITTLDIYCNFLYQKLIFRIADPTKYTSFNVEDVIKLPVFWLTGASQENAEAGKWYNFLTEDKYTQCYMKGHTVRIRVNLVFKQVISRATEHHACPEPW